jgi:hypothetical protein
MMHGDPLNQFTPIGRYRMLVGGRDIEDKADAYDATFMRYQDHDIRPVLDFLCSIPDAGPGDPHSSGPDRAKHVVAIYSVPDRRIKVPCAEDDDSSSDSAQFENGIRTMAEASRHKFSAVRGSALGNGRYESSIKLTGLGWRDEKYEFSIDGENVDHCGYVLSMHDQSQVDSQ